MITKTEMVTSLRLLCLMTQFGLLTATQKNSQESRSTSKGINLLEGLTADDGVQRILPSGIQFGDEYYGHNLLVAQTSTILSEFSGELTLYISGSLFGNGTLPLLTISSPNYRAPYLEIWIETDVRQVVMKYLGEKSMQRVTITDALPPWEWRNILIHVNGTNLIVKVDCGEDIVKILKQRFSPITYDSEILFGVSSDGEKSFKGMLYQAFLYLSAENRMCSNKIDDGLQSDESSIILGSPYDDRVLLLEQQITQLVVMVDMLKTQNAQLTTRVGYLETCECRPSCTYNGSIIEEGGMWTPELCTVCTCERGRPSCSRRLDIPSCATPCISSPCSNNGQCVDVNISDKTEFTCQCHSPYDGSTCQIRRNPCSFPPDVGTCSETIPRYFYDKHTQHCLPFNFTGCGGNPNNFVTETDCEGMTMKGACCFRTYSTIVSDIAQGSQRLQVECQSLHFSECQALHRQPHGDSESEVISFTPGMTCEETGCLTDTGCTKDYNVGDALRLGCQSCTCLNGGGLQCSCEQMTVRKEIRDMTREELVRFQNAVIQLRGFGDVSIWEEYRDLYMKHGMHSNGGQFYLPWHRLFLRRLEQKLQEIDCNVVLPYVDFSTDVGDFSNAVIWQTDYFGGDGNSQSGCVTDHPFGGSNPWRPCIMRNFNISIKLPTAVEIALAIASEDYTEMSLCLETYAAYVHNYIGGDMATSSSPYDPVFYAIHAYIDMLYWSWQKRHDNKFKYPALFGNIPMIPFNIPPSDVLDSEALCVTYALPSKGGMCNVTVPTLPGSPGVQRGDQSPEVVDTINRYNQFGYNIEDTDLLRFNRYGFRPDGFNRDGYDREGYDSYGYNRYGKDREGYDQYGYNIDGIDRNGNQDTSDRYSDDGYDMNCLDRLGLSRLGRDKFGFNINGYDLNGCNAMFNGPFSLIHSFVIMEALGNQAKGFLMTLHRTCEPLDPVPNSWYDQFWVTQIKDVTTMVPAKFSPTQSLPSSRFCIEADPLLSPCACESTSTTCTENPCLTGLCPAYPEAVCHFSYCGDCKATWYFNNMEVDCHSERDYCKPNPCKHGGECIPSIWPEEPSLVTCICPPGYDGHLCQYLAVDICSLPVDTGKCSERETRWHFNYRSQKCEEFIYTGCHGNANNFNSIDACQNRCMIGACCYREPVFKKKIIGYSLQGYDRYGYSIAGINIAGDRVTIETGTETGRERFTQGGLDWQGYDRNGYDLEGYDRFGYNRLGFDREGFNATGFSRLGEYDGIIDYDITGFDMDGFNRAGYSCLGHNRLGLNVYRTTAAYKYLCRSMTLDRCQGLEEDGETEVVKYTFGKQCEEAKCGDMCGCTYDNKTYSIGETFVVGCQTCRCSVTGTVSCQCEMPVKRIEVRDMREDEMQNYQRAIRSLQLIRNDKPTNKWFEIASIYANHKPQAVGTNSFLPWNRYFLRLVERHLQDNDCRVSIPYYDWTVDAGKPAKSIIWAANMFGGNGMGVTGCVRYHPFKDYYPPYWSPCLRRQFNSSVSLPDAVHVQLAMNEPTYERFRIRMEIFAKLYQGFVGGHMSSEYAPYDPLYFSLMAYIDKLWNDWQMKYDNGLLRYPRSSLFIPMVPFKSTPDEVMESRLQMCVEYVPITKGTDCNITEIRHYGYDEEGYDRHGFNQVGFDRDGYDVTGLDVNGGVDTRSIYIDQGYNKQGYGRDGYDSSGFDRYGFYVDSYNLDGYNAEGYDRQGYDRYGFDKNGFNSFGLNRNGSSKMDRVISQVKIFDDYGYNKFGFDKYGFDRDGYDIYGFDASGFDRMMCNYYYLGPMYMLVKQYVEMKLKNLDNETLISINRPCPFVSDLEQWQITTNWLSRNRQVAMIDMIDLERNISIVGRYVGNTWRPTPPDDRLCIVSQMYTNCDVGQMPVLCDEDMCNGRTCPGHPTSVCRTSNCGSCYHEWYDGITGNLLNCTGCTTQQGDEKHEGERWKNSICDGCVCENGMSICTETICPSIYCQHPIHLDDQCCPTCDAGCDFNGQVFPTGSRFRPENDVCSVCDCMRGNVSCRALPCVPLDDCQSIVKPDGECCSICLDCGQHAHGQQWNPSPCQTCTCNRGEAVCEQILCGIPDCAHPYTPDGECCPGCRDCYYEGKLYQDGEQFRKDECSTCRCHQGNIECQEPECPSVNCRNAITLPGQCCPSCENDCTYEGRVFKHKELFMPTYNMCLNCSCFNSLVRCTPRVCPVNNLPCDQPLKRLGECCPSYCAKTTCEHEGREYSDGESWTPRSPCQRCDCRNGEVICRVRETCSLECTHGVVTAGKCCSICSDCLYDGRVIGNGKNFIRGGEGETCQQCMCKQGNIECTLSERCPDLTCMRPRTNRGDCCPSCPVCDYQGRTYQHGDIVSKEQCLTCTCLDGQVQCEKEKCPNKRCRQPKFSDNQCCPDCDGCEYYNQVFDEGQRFLSPRDTCQNCICQQGQVTCESIESTCPPTSCTHPEQVRNQCCRRCDGCEYLRRRFKHGQKFSPPGEDKCRVCSCQYGSVKCERMECPDVNCLEPKLLPGSCCPSCKATCMLGDTEYREGQQFEDPRNQCSVCNCRNGEIVCTARNCPILACSHPATVPNQCCATCEFCYYERRIFRSMQRFIHPNDTCQECVCQDGSVTCSKIDCPVLPCRDTMPMAGSCCHVCPKSCDYGGLTYADGQTFSSPDDKCKDCLCRQGQVLCQRSSCPRVNCKNPANEKCCPMCDNCMYQGLLWRNGQRFKDQRDPCIKCQCQNGNVECNQKQCPQVTCSNPMMKDCCPVCSECKIGNQMFRNGQSFTNPRNKCETCTCRDGTVSCKNSMCPPALCRYPVKDGCCMVCSDCLIDGRTYRNGQSFPSQQKRCEECQCTEGDIVCKPKVCPPVMCSNPTNGQCCKECRNCDYNGQTIREGGRIRDAANQCNECECRAGNINCFKIQCRNSICSHPVQRGCCQECSDCSLNGREYKNGQEFPDVTDKCQSCHCLNGQINCRQLTCPRANCQNPVQGECCLECTNCLYNDRMYLDGQSFPDASDACKTCTCENGNVDCRRSQCPPTSCSHPIQGKCCPECGGHCFFQNRDYENGAEFERDCKSCSCNNGNVRCYPKYCPSVQCSNPITEDCCPVCGDCMFENRRFYNGQSFPDVKDSCSECICRNGTFKCSKKTCSAVSCRNPAIGQCCPECRNCNFDGKTLNHGYRFPDPSDPCTICTCEMGNINCVAKKCPVGSDCQHPVVDRCGCKSCDQCDYNGQVYQHLEKFNHRTEECLECTCKRGTVDCGARPCSVSCTHSAKDSGCCPECKDCLYEGKVHDEGERFMSDVDPCLQCTCRRGSVLTQNVQCPTPRCRNPIKLPNECCASCPVCNFLGQTYNDNTEFPHPEDACQICECQAGRVKCTKLECSVTCSHPRQDICCPICDQCFYDGKLYDNGATFKPNNCKTCYCRDGNVACDEERCLVLPCAMSEKIPGQCCPVCKGCTYKGIQYKTGATWILPDNPCVKCTCHGGLVTCMELECFVPCYNPIQVPGQCCPVCPSCKYNGRDYGDGELFTPNGDPCDSCSCQDGNLQCLRETCPNVANCPPEQLVPSQNGDCCPTCAGFGTNCTRVDLGMVIRPRPEDPCFYCECKDDFNWLCMKDQCPPLSCPPDVQIKEKGKCCSSCPSCFDEQEGKYHNEGDSWLSLDNPCVNCECHDGLKQCSTVDCPPLFCGVNEQIINQPDSCCGVCQPMKLVECFYVGRRYEPGEEWTVDECTKCQCVGGEIKCTSQHCLPTECRPNEVPSIKPGNCCPVCEQKPGSCLVFGDPHYRTFDGTTLHFQGQCKYIMAADCEGDSFSVEIQHDNRGIVGDVSWAQNFTVKIAGLTIDLLQKHAVQVNGERVLLPYLYEPHVQIELSGNTVLLNTDIGMRLLWNGESYAELSVPGTMKRKLCGLCGNFNGFPQDDLRTRLGQITNSPAVFGNSWKAKTQYKDSCQDAKDIDPCLKVGYRVRKLATTKCAVIKSKVFSRCHRAVSPEPFFASCVYDMCVCMENPNCLCDILASYAHVCAKAGVKTQWRTNKLCAFDCPADTGLIFDDCGPACPRTCENLNTPLGNVSENCFKPCVASCQCSADKVLHAGKCINPKECPNINS